MPGSPSAPSSSAASARATDFSALFARERLLVMEERHRQAIAARWSIAALALLLAVVGRLTGLLPISVPAALLLAAISVGLNLAAVALLRGGYFAPWQFWAMLCVDTLLLGALVLLLGERGYLVMPLVVFGIVGYAVGMPRAARIAWAVAALVYPVARYAGLQLVGYAPASRLALVLLETAFLLLSAGLAARGPITYTRRLRRIRSAVARMEQGDFGEVRASRALDDIGFLSVSLQAMSRSIGTLVGEIQERARSLAAMSDALAATTHQMQSTTENVGATADDLARDAEQQRELVVGGVAAVEEAGGTTATLTRDAGSSSRVAMRQAREAEEQAARIGRAADVLLELQEDYRGLGEAAAAMEAASERINGFVDTIQGIAEQTRTLALNAAIEAARAGEQGQGFAVVAAEVRSLAAQAAESAGEVAAVVEQTREAFGALRQRLRAGTDRLSGVGEIARGGRAALDVMVATFSDTAQQIETRAERMHGLAGTMDVLRTDMLRIREIAERAVDRAQDTAAATQEQTAAMQELTATSQHAAETAAALHHLVDRFTVVDAAAPASGAAEAPAPAPRLPAPTVLPPQPSGAPG